MTTSANPTLQQLLEDKLRPHAERVLAGEPNEFDYLPAALHHANEHAASALAHVTQLILKLELEQRTCFETIAANLSQSDADANEHSASARTRLGEQSDRTREHVTQLILRLELDQRTCFEKITANLNQSDAGIQQRVAELALKTRENLAVLLRTIQSDEEKHFERYVALNRRTNMLLYSSLGIAAVTVVLLFFLLLKR